MDISKSSLAGMTKDRGGAATSREGNNVFSVQPTVYFEGMDPTKESANVYTTPMSEAGSFNPTIVATAAVAAGIVAVAGTATFIYFEGA